MANKQEMPKFYHKTSFRVIAGGLVVAIFFTMVLHPAIFVAIRGSGDKADAAVNYLVDNTEFINKSTPQRVMEYLETFSSKDTLVDYYRLASTQIAREEYNTALANIEKCIALYNDEGQDLYIDLLLKRGCLQVILGDYDAALKSLDLALAEGSIAADIYLIKAQIYSEQEDIDRFVESLTEYLKLVPQDSSIRSLLAQAKFVDGDYQAAAQQYAEILETDPKAEIEYLYGLNAVKNSDFVTGEAFLTSAIAKNDTFDGIYYYRGVCRMAQGNYTEAIQDFTISIERKDMLQASYFTRGVCLLGDNQYEKGLMDIEYAIGLNDDEEITKQAQLLIAELETAQVLETLSPEETAKMAERAQLEETLKPKETEPSKEILQPEPGQSINQ